MADLADKIRRRVEAMLDIDDPLVLRDSIFAVLHLHRAHRIYELCGHNHADGEPETCEFDDVGLVCEDGYLYTICCDCCTSDGYQTEQCVDDHEHGCWPCATVNAVASALGITEAVTP